MENATLEVHLGEAPSHKSKLAYRKPKGEPTKNQTKKE
jgi:hypothetical protein